MLSESCYHIPFFGNGKTRVESVPSATYFGYKGHTEATFTPANQYKAFVISCFIQPSN